MSNRYKGAVLSTVAPTTTSAALFGTAPGLWTLRQQLQAQSGSGWPTVYDPYFSQVGLFLTGNGTNGTQNNTFLDSSSNNFTITRTGNPTQGAESPYRSFWSAYFEWDGTTPYLAFPSDSAFAFNTGDWTVEAWVSPTRYFNPHTIFATNNQSFQNNAGAIQYYDTASGTIVASSATIPLGAWTHLAWVRSGSTLTMYVNGTSVVSGAVSNSGSGATALYIGAENTTSTNEMLGSISNARVVVGTALYTANFTPSTVPLTAVSGTLVLACQSNRFIDNSSNNWTITPSANNRLYATNFSPFNPNSSYTNAQTGGSAYFDGSGGYLTTPTSGQFAPSGDFTIGVWVYLTTLVSYIGTQGIVGNYTGNNATDWFIQVTYTGVVQFYTNGSTARIESSAGTIKQNQWAYISMSRSGSTITGYVNGVSVGTYTQAGTFGSATKTIYVGVRNVSGYPLVNSYVSDLKLVDGTATTSVPTSPQTATAGTNLLLSFTNAGILDAAAQNVVETVGSAQLSSGVTKYYGTSLYFDGSGDYLSVPFSWENFYVTSAPFTYEFWVYPNTVTGTFTLINRRPTSASIYWMLIQIVNGSFKFYASSDGASWDIANNVTIGTATASAWQYVTVVRNGSSFLGFVNGVAVTLATSTSPISEPQTPFQIGGDTNANYFNGYLSDFRYTNGVARYTSNFTPPAAALPTF